jgi:GNAT superfamily N-acetyltransferase
MLSRISNQARRATASYWICKDNRKLRLVPVDTKNPEECWLWQSCELAIYANHRLHEPTNGLTLEADRRRELEQRVIVGDERLMDLTRVEWLDFYWIERKADDRRIGIVSVQRPVSDSQPFIKVIDLYIAPPFRGAGLGLATLRTIREDVEARGFAGITLHTEWCWQAPLIYFLSHGFWVSGWKRDLSLVWMSDLPGYEIVNDGEGLTFLLRPVDESGKPGVALYRARKHGADDRWLKWQETEDALQRVNDPRRFFEWHYGRCTFAVELALRGWPLVRDERAWAERLRWSDAGMPEGLADKIRIFEHLERDKGFGCGKGALIPEELPPSPEWVGERGTWS